MTVTREVISGDGVPATIGPYSPAVRAGDFVYVSGQQAWTQRPASPLVQI